MHKPQYHTIGIMIFGLAAVLVLIYYVSTFQRNTPLPEPSVPPVPGDERVEVSGEYYYNTLQDFSLKVPSAAWEISAITETATIPYVDAGKTVLANTVPMAEFSYRLNGETVAVTEVGVVRSNTDRNVRDFAIQILGEILEQVERGDGRVTISKEVSLLSQRTPKGAYFMIVLPASSGDRLPVWVYAVFIEGEYVYTILNKTSEAQYSTVRSDLEAIIESFRILAS